MKKRVFFIQLLILQLCLSAYAYDDGDFQVWHTENQEKKINGYSKVSLEEEVRFADDASELFYHHYDAGYQYDLNRHLSLGVNYRQVYEKKQGKFKEENRPHINAILKFSPAGVKFEDRNRLEYRHFAYQEDSWRYRNKFSVKKTVKLFGKELQPFLADEIFLNLNGIDLNRNRFYSGFGFEITKIAKAEIFYLLQSSKNSGEWNNSNILGTKLKLVF